MAQVTVDANDMADVLVTGAGTGDGDVIVKNASGETLVSMPQWVENAKRVKCDYHQPSPLFRCPRRLFP
jgi:hypothetical protein